MPDPLLRPDGGPIITVTDREICQQTWRADFARYVYGPIPSPPDRLTVHRTPIDGDTGERLQIGLEANGRSFDVDAALWLPHKRSGKIPLIIGLGFLGPIGAMAGSGFPIDPEAIVEKSVANTQRGGRICEENRGQHQDRWPIESLLSAGYGVVLSCYGSWMPDHPRKWRTTGLRRLFEPSFQTGALSWWAWAYQRLVDVALRLPDVGQVTLAGHSRLGKAALWAGATDQRVDGVLVNNSGCAGASLSCHTKGETLKKLRARFPHWTVLDRRMADRPELLPVDQHHLIACMAPRVVYVASATGDEWADPEGEYMALRAAASVWGIDGDLSQLPPIDRIWRPGCRLWSGNLAWHLRRGDHEMTRWDWRRFLAFLERRRRLESA